MGVCITPMSPSMSRSKAQCQFFYMVGKVFTRITGVKYNMSAQFQMNTWFSTHQYYNKTITREADAGYSQHDNALFSQQTTYLEHAFELSRRDLSMTDNTIGFSRRY